MKTALGLQARSFSRLQESAWSLR